MKFGGGSIGGGRDTRTRIGIRPVIVQGLTGGDIGNNLGKDKGGFGATLLGRLGGEGYHGSGGVPNERLCQSLWISYLSW